jgi:hypothetical protein
VALGSEVCSYKREPGADIYVKLISEHIVHTQNMPIYNVNEFGDIFQY